jgi:hypothetical protein
MPYGINNNIFHGANKLQEKNTLAFNNWTLQIKSLMKSAHSGQVQLIYGLSNYKSFEIKIMPLYMSREDLYFVK